MRVLVFVAQSFGGSRWRGVFDESLVVEAEQGVVLVEHNVRCGCGGVVSDQGTKVCYAAVIFRPQQGRPGPVIPAVTKACG
jgi:hypothetical protein